MPGLVSDVNEKVYIHELIDVIGHNRARYMHHMTANWCPVAREERNQLCFGVWGTVGSTGRWPEVVNMWELDGWDGLVANFSHELSHDSLQDPSLAEWWAAAAELRRGGVDRIVVPEPWTDPIGALVARGVRGEVYAHEMFGCAPGRSHDVLAQLHDIALPAAASLGMTCVGAFDVAMVNGSECLAIWALPDWNTWADYERAWDVGGAMRPWAERLATAGTTTARSLMVDAPLAPLRIGRQPEVGDRRPLDAL
jgi:hypothetical protein